MKSKFNLEFKRLSLKSLGESLFLSFTATLLKLHSTSTGTRIVTTDFLPFSYIDYIICCFSWLSKAFVAFQ